jgi:exodeoxyribonuclease V alpha subunit
MLDAAPSFQTPIDRANSRAVDPSADASANRPADDAQRDLAQAVSDRVLRWSLQAGAAALAAQAAAQAARRLSQAASEGHVCIRVLDAKAQAALMASRVVQRHDVANAASNATAAAVPMVLDADGRLYFHRHFHDELGLAKRLLLTRQMATVPPVTEAVKQLLRQLFKPDPLKEPNDALDRQQVAVAVALLQPLVVISGGPGTGKTTTLAKLLRCLLAQSPTLRVGLAAPTGKAAARMAAALAAPLHGATQDAPTLPPLPARTVHAWLGVHPHTGLARHHRDKPLPLDLLVVDEASMLDIALAHQLMVALPPTARVVLLGDKDQLAAVEPGALFAELAAHSTMDNAILAAVADLCNVAPQTLLDALLADQAQPLARTTHTSPAPTPTTTSTPALDHHHATTSPLTSSVVWLVKSHRFDSNSTLGTLAQHVRVGDANQAMTLLHALESPAMAGGTVAWQSNDDTAALNALLNEGLASYVDAVINMVKSPTTIESQAATALKAFDTFRWLCATTVGPQGTRNINQRAARTLSRHLLAAGIAVDANDPWSAGRPVMVKRNDASLGLNNGDIGIVLPRDTPDALPKVAFPAPQSTTDSGDTGLIVWPAIRLPPVETAFATTVHKAQGSEFAHVVVLLPSPWQRPCTRELLYTAITRAKHRVTLVAAEGTMRQSIDTRTERLGGLSARLRGR